jgi:hypothetical protein
MALILVGGHDSGDKRPFAFQSLHQSSKPSPTGFVLSNYRATQRHCSAAPSEQPPT